MSNYLFTLTITPIQSFISQARKTKDLFVGSEILSSLMRKALEILDKEEIIFPQSRDFVSNKFVVQLNNKSKDDIEKIAKKLEDGINNNYINMIFKTTKRCDNNLQNFFKVFWVAVKLKDDYRESYKKLEQNLGAVKNLRDFKQESQPKGIEKCSLCGERNIVEKEDKDKKEDKKEKLCLICLTKRECEIEGSDNNLSISTANIVLNDYVKSGDEAQNFLEDNPSEKKYYALVQFDIDDMGKKLSSLDEEGQKELSKALAEFGKEAKDIVDKSGETIYAGGDDFLGFVNLEYLFEVIEDIKEAFEIENLTYSTSIIIAHYKAPLHKVLDFSRELLAETKAHFDNKNGVGIVVLSNSAINAKTICRYENLELLKEMKEQKVGMSLHYKLQTLFSYLDNMSYDEFLIQKEMIKVEIKRLLKREDGNFDEKIYNSLIAFFNNQKIERSTNSYEIDLDNFIGYLKTLEQLRKVM